MLVSILLAQISQVMQNPQVQASKLWLQSFYGSALTPLEILGVLLTLFFIASTLFFMIRTGWLPTRIDRTEDIILKKNLPKKKSIKGWRRVQGNFFKGDDNSLKIAIMEADKILDEALKAGGFKGENLGDRLKKLTEAQIPNLNEVWEAHKLRNRIAHETDFKLNRDTAERALSIFENAFKDLGLLD